MTTLPASLSRLQRSGMLRGARLAGQGGEWGPGLEGDRDSPQILPGLERDRDSPPPLLRAAGSGTAAAPNCPHAGKRPGQPPDHPGLEGDRDSHKTLSGAGKGPGHPLNPLRGWRETGTALNPPPGLDGDRDIL